MGGAKSNRKGKSGERELARKLRSLSPALFGDARRNFCQSRKLGEVPDLEVHDDLWPECKRMRRCSPAAALRQAIEETRIAGSDRVPIAFCRDDDGEWTVTLRLTDWVPMFEDSHDLRSVCVTSARAAELEAETACKALQEATGRLEPVDDDFDIQIGPPSKVVPVEDIEKLYPGTTQRAIEMLSDPRFRARFNGLTAEHARDLFDRGVETAAEEMRVVSVSTRKPSSPE